MEVSHIGRNQCNILLLCVTRAVLTVTAPLYFLPSHRLVKKCTFFDNAFVRVWWFLVCVLSTFYCGEIRFFSNHPAQTSQADYFPMSVSQDGRPPWQEVLSEKGLNKWNPGSLMGPLPFPVRRVLYKLGVWQKLCHLCGRKDHLLGGCPCSAQGCAAEDLR